MIHTTQTDGMDVTAWALPEGALARLGRGRIRGGLTFSPDGDSLVVATDIGCWLYDLETLTPRALWNTERGMVSAISFSHDGQWIATGNLDGTVKVWDAQTLQCVSTIGLTQTAFLLSFSSDGKHLALAGSTWTVVYVWRVNTTTPILNFAFTRKHRVSHVASTAFSPDGSLFAYKSGYNLTSVMAIETGEIVAEFPDTYTEDPVGCTKLAFSPCGEFLAGCNYKDTVHVWDIQSGNFAMEPTTYHQSTRVLPTYLSDGTLRVAARHPKEIVIWNAKLQEKVDSIAYSGGTLACFSVNDRKFATLSRYNDIQVWHEGSPSKVVSISEHLHPDPVQRFPSTLVFSKDSRTLFCGYWKHIGFLAWDVSRRQIVRTFPQKSDEYAPHPHMTFTMSRNAELIAIALARIRNSVIRVLDVSSGTQVAELKADSRGVSGLTFSRTGDYLVSGSPRSLSKVWDVSSGTQVAELTEKDDPLSKPFGNTVFSPKSEYFLSIRKESISVWDTLKWEHLYESNLKEFKGFETLVSFHPNGEHFFTAPREGAAIIWDLKSGEQVGSLPTEICLDTTLYRGEPQEIQRIREQQKTTPRRIWALKASRCGTLIVGAMFGEIRMWDAATLETKMTIIPPAGCQKSFILAFSFCSKYLATGAWWQEGQTRMAIRLWNIATGENIHTFWAHPTDIDRLRFSPDGKYLASGSYDGTILLWDMTPYL